MASKKAKSEGALSAAGIATAEENEALEHSAGGMTTRDDALDLGVPMLPGSPDEPVGPEDALGPGPKRGDYTNRIGDSNYHPHEGATPQRPRAENIGDEAGVKGGVDTVADEDEARPMTARAQADREAAAEVAANTGTTGEENAGATGDENTESAEG